MTNIRMILILTVGLATAGCTNNPWVSPFKKERTETQANRSQQGGQSPVQPIQVYPVKRGDLTWEGVMSSVASAAPARQAAVVAYLKQKLEAKATPDVKLRLAFMLGFSLDSVRDQAKALSLYKQIPQQAHETLSSKMLPALAMVMLTELQVKRSQIWWLKEDKEKLLSEKKESEAQIKRLEEKLKAIRSIEESIHQRNR